MRRRYAAAKRSISCGIDGFMSALALELELASLLTRRLRSVVEEPLWDGNSWR